MDPTMMDALRLTREGHLGAATDLIQAMLGGKVSVTPGTASYAPGSNGPDVGIACGRRGGFTDHVFATEQGRIRYKLYRPSTIVEPAPLIVMLHGCTQSANDFAAGTGMNALADEFGVLVAYPEQSRAANAQGCWNWFRPGDQSRDRGEPALIAGLTHELIATQGVDPSRVFVAGLSAGGAAAAIMGRAYPDLYAAIGVHSGLACGTAHDLSSALAAMQRGPVAATSTATPPAGFVPSFVVHGDADHTVNAANADAIWAQTLAASPIPLDVRERRVADGAGRAYRRSTASGPDGHVRAERWTVEGAGHAWAGGAATGSYTDPSGPDASRAMLRFFLAQPPR